MAPYSPRYVARKGTYPSILTGKWGVSGKLVSNLLFISLCLLAITQDVRTTGESLTEARSDFKELDSLHDLFSTQNLNCSGTIRIHTYSIFTILLLD